MSENARWKYIADKAKLNEIGSIIDTALDSIEKGNDSLRRVLLKNFSRPELDKRILGEIRVEDIEANLQWVSF